MEQILGLILVKVAAVVVLGLLAVITVLCVNSGNVDAGICVAMMGFLGIVCVSILEEKELYKEEF